jgi:ABC-type molybdate transport system ATPase subunit
VDTYTEEEILSRLRGVMRQRTSIIVSHRVSTVRDADQIFVLENGRIAERGSHDTLVARGGLYAALYRKQLLEEELQASCSGGAPPHTRLGRWRGRLRPAPLPRGRALRAAVLRPDVEPHNGHYRVRSGSA